MKCVHTFFYHNLYRVSIISVFLYIFLQSSSLGNVNSTAKGKRISS